MARTSLLVVDSHGRCGEMQLTGLYFREARLLQTLRLEVNGVAPWLCKAASVASALADRAIPLQANYCAAKHALKAFTDALRMKLQQEGVPISVSLMKPASIDTPFFEEAKTDLDVEPQPVPPVSAPEIVAAAIRARAARPIRDVIVGGAADRHSCRWPSG